MRVQATPAVAVALIIAHRTTKIIRSRSLLDGVSRRPKDQGFTRRLEIVVFRHPHPSPNSPTGVAGVRVSSGQERSRHRQIRLVSVPPDHDVIDSRGGSVEAEPGILPAYVRHRPEERDAEFSSVVHLRRKLKFEFSREKKVGCF